MRLTSPWCLSLLDDQHSCRGVLGHNIELKSTVAQNKNLAAKGVFGIRVPLRFFFSFRLNKNNPRDIFTDQ